MTVKDGDEWGSRSGTAGQGSLRCVAVRGMPEQESCCGTYRQGVFTLERAEREHGNA